MEHLTCALCGEKAKSDRFDRLSGLNLCTPCARGGAEAAVEKRGWSMNSRTWVQRTKNATFYHHEVRAALAQEPPIKATFRFKSGLWKALGWILRPVRTGDDLFDRTVQVGTSSRDETEEFLRSEGAQSAIMDLVGEQATIKLEPAGVRAHAVSTHGPPDEFRLELETAVLLIHLETFATVHAMSA